MSEIVTAVTAFTIPASTGLFNVDVDLGGLTPKLVEFYSSSSDVIDTVYFHGELGYGAADGTNQFVVAGRERATTTSVGDRISKNDHCINTYNSLVNDKIRVAFSKFRTTTDTGSGLTGVELNCTLADTEGNTVIAVFYAGADLNVKVGEINLGTGTSPITESLSFTPTLVKTASVDLPINFGRSADWVMSLGAMSAVAQGCTSVFSDRPFNPSVVHSRVFDDVVAAPLTASGIQYTVLGAIVTNGFELTPSSSASGRALQYVAMDTGDRAVWVGPLDSPAASPFVNNSPGFKPQLAGIFAGIAEAYNVEHPHIGSCVSVFSPTVKYNQNCRVKDNVSPIESDGFHSSNHITFRDQDGTTLFESNQATDPFTGTGWSISMSTVNATVYKWVGWAIEEIAAATTNTITASLDSLLKKQISATSSISAVLQKQGITQTSSIDAALQKAMTVTSSLDSLLKDSITISSIIDAAIQKQGESLTASIDAELQKQGITETSVIDAIISAQGLNITSIIDSVLSKQGINVTAIIDSVLQKTGVNISATIDAILQGAGTNITAVLDAAIRKNDISKTAVIDAVLQKQGIEITANIDSILKVQGITATATLQALIQKTASVTASLDALITLSGNNILATMDSLLQKTLSVSSSIDAIVQKTGITASATIDGVLIRAYMLTASIDSILRKTLSVNSTIDAAVMKSGLTANATIDAIISILSSATTSLDRIYSIQAEDRVFSIQADERVFSIN